MAHLMFEVTLRGEDTFKTLPRHFPDRRHRLSMTDLPRKFLFGITAFALVLAAPVHAVPHDQVDQPTDRKDPRNYETDENYKNQIWRWSNSQIRGISEAKLPDTQPGGTWRLSVSPRFGDFFNREYVRWPIGAMYGITDRTEVGVLVQPYSPNPFNSGGEWGMANYLMSAKHQWSSPKAVAFASATGIDIKIPVEGAPVDSNEGMNRYSFYTTFGKSPKALEDYYVYMSLGYDMLTDSDADGFIPDWKPQDDFTEVVVGVLYHRNDIVWGLSAGWQHVVDGHSDDYFNIIPSATFDVPPRFVLDLPGRVQVGTSIEFRYHDGRIDPHARAKVRWLIDFQKAVEAITERVPLPSMPSIPFINGGDKGEGDNGN